MPLHVVLHLLSKLFEPESRKKWWDKPKTYQITNYLAQNVFWNIFCECVECWILFIHEIMHGRFVMFLTKGFFSHFWFVSFVKNTAFNCMSKHLSSIITWKKDKINFGWNVSIEMQNYLLLWVSNFQLDFINPSISLNGSFAIGVVRSTVKEAW